jgi:hypothetical protein
MTEQDLYDAFHLMEALGGGFASRLAKAWFYADSGNRTRIEAAFPEMIGRYAAMAEQRK